jgi:hypothetical protein
MTSGAAAGNDLLALLLILVATMGRSGEAVVLGQVAGQPGIGVSALLFALVVVGAGIGRKLVFALEAVYHNTISKFDPRWTSALVIVLGLWQLAATSAPGFALVLMLAATAISLWSRSQRLPQQVAFGALALPLVVQYMGGVPTINLALGF